jgi:NAD(P)-dependent dehydrogenase (short-subunit alcohol dehydrogenase family)
MPQRSLEGAHVVVVGGSSGIGKGVVEAAVAEGARVTIGARDQQRLDAVVAEFGGTVRAAPVDVTREDTVAEFFAGIDLVDHLAVCPGDDAPGSIYALSAAAIHRCLSTKIVGKLLCVRHAAPRMPLDGSIVLLSGPTGHRPLAGFSVTGAANVGIGTLGRTLAIELAPVRVNVVVPGMIDTPFWQRIPEAERAAMFASTVTQVPAGRIGRPSDVAAEVIHLFHAEYVTGNVVFVDGGGSL